MDGKSYHDAKAEGKRTRQENITVLYMKVLRLRKPLEDQVDVYDACADYTG